MDILAIHLFLLQQASDVSPELMVNAFVCTEDGALGKPVSGFMGLSQEVSLQAGIGFQNIARGGEDLAGATELVAAVLDRRGMRFWRLERAQSASLLRFVELPNMFVKLRPVADDDKAVPVEVTVKLLLFTRRHGNHRARGEHPTIRRPLAKNVGAPAAKSLFDFWATLKLYCMVTH